MAEHFLYIGIPHNANKGWIDPDSSLQSTGRNERNSDVQETVIPFVEELNSAKEYMYETFKGVRAIDLYTSTYNDYIREKYTNWGKTWIYHRPALRRGGTETVLNPYNNSYHYKTLETVGLSTVFKLDVDEYPTYIKFGEGDNGGDPQGYTCPFPNASNASGTATLWLTDQCGNYAIPIDISSYGNLDGIEPSRGWGTSQNYPYNQSGVYAASSYKEGYVPRATDVIRDANGNPIMVDGHVQPIQTGEDPRALAGAELCLKIRGLSGVGIDGQLSVTIGTNYTNNCTIKLLPSTGDYANDSVAFLHNDYPYSEEYRNTEQGLVQYFLWIDDLLVRKDTAVGDELANIEAQLEILKNEIVREKKQATTIYAGRGNVIGLRGYPSSDGHVLSGFTVSAGNPPTYNEEHDIWTYVMPTPPTNVEMTPIWGPRVNQVTTVAAPKAAADTSVMIVDPEAWFTKDNLNQLSDENKTRATEQVNKVARLKNARNQLTEETEEWNEANEAYLEAVNELRLLYNEIYNSNFTYGQQIAVHTSIKDLEFRFSKWNISGATFDDETVLLSTDVQFAMPSSPVHAIAEYEQRTLKWIDSTFNTIKHDQEVTVTRNGDAVDSFGQPITYYLYIDGVESAVFPDNSRSVTVTLGIETESSTLQFKLVAKAPKMADATQFIEAHGTEYPYEVGDFHRTVEYWHTVNGVQQFTTCIPYYCVREEDNLVFVEVEPYIFHNGEWILCSTI